MSDISDSFDSFAANFDTNKPYLLHRVFVADIQTPVSAFLKLGSGKDNCFLLESVEGGEVRGRFSVIGMSPDLIWRCRGNVAECNRDPANSDHFTAVSEAPLISLRTLLAESEMENTGDLPPMSAGLFGYFGYDMIRHIEDIPDQNDAAFDVYDSVLLRPSIVAIFDRLKDTITLVTQVRPSEWKDAQTAWDAAQSRLQSAVKELDAPIPQTEEGDANAALPAPETNMVKSTFLEMVRKAKEHIRAGDIFQVVLSQRFTIPFHLPAINLGLTRGARGG